MKQKTTTIILPALSNMYKSAIEREKVWLWLIILAGALVRLYRLNSQSLWTDEGLQYFVASAESLSDMLGRRSHTFHPLLSLLINHVFLLLGKSDFYLRLPSMLFGIGSLPLCYVLAKRVTCPLAAVFAVLVLAISPFHIWYSQEGRMYAQLLFLSLLSTVLLMRALERGKLHLWAFYTLIITAGVYTHVLMVLGAMAQLLWVRLYHRQHLLAYGTSSAAAVLLCLPLAGRWMGIFFHLAGRASVSTSAEFVERLGFPWPALLYTFFVYGAGFSLGPSVAELHENKSLEFILQFLPSILAVGVIFGTFLVIGLLVLYKRCGTQSRSLCLLGLGVPLGGVAALSLMTAFAFNVRYTIVAFPYFCILIGMALASIGRRNILAGMVAVLALLGVSAASLSNHFFNPRYAKEEIRSAVVFWRSVSTHEYLFSSSTAGGVRDAINYYLDSSERKRHIPIGSKDIIGQINAFFSTHNISSAYIILVRDWHQPIEKSIRDSFIVDHEQSYPGTKILKISRQ
jgi:uncharacterized membrane protein